MLFILLFMLKNSKKQGNLEEKLRRVETGWIQREKRREREIEMEQGDRCGVSRYF